MRALAILGTLTLSGCIVAHDWIARGASGTVVDAASGKPLPGVSVLRVVGSRENQPTLVATTDAGGQFSVPALTQWYATIPMGDAFGVSQLVFRLPGYKEATVDTSTGTAAPKTPPLTSLVVKLHRKA
jgi:hypothetical protein